MPIIGCHISIAGGVEKAPGRAQALGCDGMQIFTSNQMQWRGTPITDESQQAYQEQLSVNNIQMTITHDSYLINLGSPEKKKLALSRKAFTEEIQRSTKLKIPYIVFHPGSHMNTNEDDCLSRIAASLDYCLEKESSSDITLLLEITAGQGSNVGYSFEHLQTIIERSANPDRLGICFDTCHAYAAGYDLKSAEKYTETFQRLDDVLGLERLKVFHFNDCKKPLGSRVDRHAQLGQGYLGMEPFERLVNDARFADLPMMLETPGQPEHYAEEIKLLKAARR